MIAFYNGKYQDEKELRIHPQDRGYLFADGVYEVVRFYQGKPFLMEEHQLRLQVGARELRFNRLEFPEFKEICMKLQKVNQLEEHPSSIVYFQVTRGIAPRSHAFPPPETPLSIYAFARLFQSNLQEQERGVGVITVEDERWSNCHIKTIALLPNTLAHQKAREHGCSEALFVRKGLLQEGTHSNLFLVSDGVVKTPPLSRFILPGITRKTVLDILKHESIPYLEEDITLEEFYRAEEAFICGTTVEITPIVMVNSEKVGTGEPGPVTRTIQRKYLSLCRDES